MRRSFDGPLGRWVRVVFALMLAGTLVISAVTGARATPGPSAAHASRRVTVGLFGDSVTEGLVIPHFLTQGLAAQLTRAEAANGYSPGGVGFIAADEHLWHFNAYGSFGFSKTPADGWSIVGAQDGDRLEPGTDGISGYSARTVSPHATASTTVNAPDIEVLYASSTRQCDFRVTSGARTWTIGTYRPGTVAAEETPIVLGPGKHSLTVHGATCPGSKKPGRLIFDGVIAHKPVTAHTTQFQFDDDGHSGVLPSTDLAPRVEEGIVAQHYTVTALL
jgi:hypothetical protein